MDESYKYLCVDTSIFVQCSLLQIEGDDINVLKDLWDILERNKVVLLLPEVIELELDKVLRDETASLKQAIGERKGLIGQKEEGLDKRIIEDLKSKMDEVVKERESNSGTVKKEIKRIFSHKSTIKIKLTNDILLESIKSMIAGKKPMKKSIKGIDSDTLIIQSLKTFLSSKDSYELYFCSQNHIDFGDSSPKDVVNSSIIAIHPDIGSNFESILYYTNLLTLLNEKFDKKYGPDEIKKAEKKEDLAVKETISDELTQSPSISTSQLSRCVSESLSASPSPSPQDETTGTLKLDTLK